MSGGEIEGWDDPAGKMKLDGCGERSSDAAPELFELIGEPAPDVDTAVGHMVELIRLLSPKAVFHHKRPGNRITNVDQWRDEARYDALKAALRAERPVDWRGVNVMTNRAATHFNFGIDWKTPAGLAWLSLMGNITPYVATQLCERFGIDCDDLLSPWQGWADPRRFSRPENWWNDLTELSRFYGEIPRLICAGDDGEPDVVPDGRIGSGDINSKFHLGTVWLFARPKLDPTGAAYAELRCMPSMDPREAAFSEVFHELHDLSAEIVTRTRGGLQRVDAADLLSDLRMNGFAATVPDRLLMRIDWDGLPVFGGQETPAAAAVA